MRYSRTLLIAGVALFGLMSAGLWASMPRLRTANLALTIPISRSSEIDVTISQPGPGYLSSDIDHGSLINFTGPVAVAIWYQDTRAVILQPVAAFALPTWPLLGIAAAMALLATQLWTHRRPAHDK
jgi:hypothetical protein